MDQTQLRREHGYKRYPLIPAVAPGRRIRFFFNFFWRPGRSGPIKAAVALLGLLGVLNAAAEKSGGVRVLVLASRNYGLNYFLYRDSFDRMGWSVTQTGTAERIPACPSARRSGVPDLLPDLALSEVKDVEEYAALVIPPGAGNFTTVPEPFGDLTASPTALDLIRKAVERGIPVSTTCSGGLVLAAAGVAKGRRLVGPARFQQRFEAAGAVFAGQDTPPVIDRGVVSGARGRYYNVAIVQALAVAVEGAWGRRGRKSRSGEWRPSIGPADIPGAARAHVLGSGAADGGRDLCRAPDGGLLLTGYTFAGGNGDSDLLLVRIDERGRILWARAFGGTGFEYGQACIPAEGGFLAVGYTTSFGSGGRDLYAVRIDGSGREIWSRTYGGDGMDMGAGACQAEDGGFYLCGSTQSFNAVEEDVYLVRIDRGGRELWARTFGGKRFETACSIGRLSDGGLLIGATTGTYGKGNSDFYVIKTDSRGREIWSKSYGTRGPDGGFGYDRCFALRPTHDRGAVLVGNTGSGDLQDGILIRIDAGGKELWTRSFGLSPFYDYGTAAVETGDGDFVAVGIAKQALSEPGLYRNRILIERIDAAGKTVRQKTLDSRGRTWVDAALLDKDGSLLLLGQTDSTGAGAFDLLLIKVGPEAPPGF